MFMVPNVSDEGQGYVARSGVLLHGSSVRVTPVKVIVVPTRRHDEEARFVVSIA